jgi:predicted enzyme related to lactoylglutathione lyase
MPSAHGDFIWYELLTTDPEAAGRFYAEVVGWTVTEPPGPVPGYRILTAPDGAVGGLMALPEGALRQGARPGWLGYVAVEDVDAAITAFLAAGGRVQMPATDLPQVGRIAMVADPEGAPLYLMRGASDQASGAFDPLAPGHCAWNELSAVDPEAALRFYAARFGWTRGEAIPMGEAGTYQLVEHGGRAIGAVQRKQHEGPPGWAFYFRVADVDAAASRATAAGGRILFGPQEVPGEDHIVIATDPQGAMFALVGKRG